MEPKGYKSKASTIQDNIIDAIRDILPEGANVANVLMDILFIGKEAVYRRLRGEVTFSLEEIATISQTLGISIDNVLNSSSPKNKQVQLRLTGDSSPSNSDYTLFDDFIKLMSSSRKDPYREIGFSTTMLPQSLYLNHRSLTKFTFFRWMYQWEGKGTFKSLDEVKIPPRLDDLFLRYRDELFHVDYIYYVWDSLIFQYLVTEIKYFANIRFISADDVAQIKEDLLKVIDEIELLAARGKFETGGKVQFYLSSINFENTYNYLQTEKHFYSYIKIFSHSAAVSQDKDMFIRLKKWIESFKRLSILISESGEIQRVSFFKEQRRMINDSL